MGDLLGLLPAPPNSSTTGGRVGCGGQTQPDPQCRSVPGVWARSVIPLDITSLNPAPAGRRHSVGSPGTGTPRAGMLASTLPFELCLWMSLARGSQVGRPLNGRTGLVGPTGKGHEPRLLGWPGASVSQRLRAPMTCGQERQCPNKTANSDESQNESCFFLPSHSIVRTPSRGSSVPHSHPHTWLALATVLSNQEEVSLRLSTLSRLEFKTAFYFLLSTFMVTSLWS